MKRRSFVDRLLAGAAAFIVAPLMGARVTEAAPAHDPDCLCETPGCLGSTPEGRDEIERMAYEQALARHWGSWDAVRIASVQTQADCSAECNLRYFGEMQSMPSYLWRHINVSGGRIVGGDIRVDTFDMRRQTTAEVEAFIVSELRRHHEHGG